MIKYDQYGQAHISQSDLCDLLYTNPGVEVAQFTVDNSSADYNHAIRHFFLDWKPLLEYKVSDTPVEEFDKLAQQAWHMPQDYKELDIAAWLLDQCQTEAELQRVGQELLLFQERDLFTLLQYMKYLVDTMRANGIVWGVGRGSSVASYVLYKLGVHHINSLFYDLDPAEFLK